MTKEVTKFDPNMLPKPGDMEQMAAVGDFPRLQIGQGTSGFVQEEKGKLGEFFLEPDHALGKKIQVLVVHTRPRAIVLSDGGLKAESFVQKSKVFKDIEHMARSNSAPDGEYPAFGPEFLLWAPDYGFFTLHMSKTMRRRSPSVLGILNVRDGKYVPGWGELECEKVVRKNTWYVCNGSKLDSKPPKLPEKGEVEEALEKFFRRMIEEGQAAAEDKTEDSSRER